MLGEQRPEGPIHEGPDRIADPLVSSRHLEVSWKNGGLYAQDLGSGNGTFVDGRVIVRPTILAANSVLSIGDTLLVLDEAPEPSSMPASPDAEEPEIPTLVGTSLVAQTLRKSLGTVAPLDGAVLLLGPTGTGKEVSARAIHELSGRTGAFIPVNCAAIPHEIAEAELFGHTKGAFTGAQAAREGYFLRADGGTLFLDEIGDLPSPLQAKLLRVLEDRRVQPVGAGGKSVPVDVRIVAATNVDLWASGFRSDLLGRLADWLIHLPPIVERRADILELWRHFEAQASGRCRKMTAEFAEALLLFEWPRNIRELRKLTNAVCTLTRPDAGLDLPALPPPMQRIIRQRFEEDDETQEAPAPPARREPLVDDDDPRAGPGRAELERALRDAKGNVKQVALENGWHRNQIYRWLKRLGMDAADYR